MRYHNDDGTYTDQKNLSYSKLYAPYMNGENMDYRKEGHYIAYWRAKDGTVLQADILHESEPNGTLAQFNKLQPADKGIYDVYPVWMPNTYYIEYLPFSTSCTGEHVFGASEYSVPVGSWTSTSYKDVVLGTGTLAANTATFKKVQSYNNVTAVRYTYGQSYSVPHCAWYHTNAQGADSLFKGWALDPSAKVGNIQPTDIISSVTPQRNQVITLYAVYDAYPVLIIEGNPKGLTYSDDSGVNDLKLLLEANSNSVSGTQLEMWLLTSCVKSATDKEDGSLLLGSNVYVSYFNKDEIGNINRPTLLTVTFTAEDSSGNMTHVTTAWEIFANGTVDILIK